jgi:hypothetical protein
MEEDRLDGAVLLGSVSEANEVELAPLRNLNLREKEGNLVPNLVARPVSAVSFALRFLLRGDAENSPSLKKPCERS